MPHLGAVCCLHAKEIAVFGERVQAIAVQRRRASRAGSAVVVPGSAERLRPDAFPIGAIQAEDEALPAVGALHEDAIAFDRQRSVAGAETGGGPHDCRSGRGPLWQQTGLLRQAGAVWALPLRPVIISTNGGSLSIEPFKRPGHDHRHHPKSEHNRGGGPKLHEAAPL